MTFIPYIQLMRLDKPIGFFLLLWPTWWAVWLASHGHPSIKILLIFTVGVFFMRSAGCIINDITDRHYDRYVKRTANRPLATHALSLAHALILFFILLLASLTLVLQCNRFTIQLAFLGAGLTMVYPWMKRWIHFPQAVLGLAFAWGIPMAYAAIQNRIPSSAWILFLTVALFALIYDTQYAMVDRDDDLALGLKSTAILFGKHDIFIVSLLQVIFIALLVWIGILNQLGSIYYLSVAISTIFFLYQYQLIQSRNRMDCFRAFLNNHWVGFTIFSGIFLSFFFSNGKNL